MRYEPFTEEQVAAVRHGLQRFLGGVDRDMDIRNLRQVQLAFRMCRTMMLQCLAGAVRFGVPPMLTCLSRSLVVCVADGRTWALMCATIGSLQVLLVAALRTSLHTPTCWWLSAGHGSPADPVPVLPTPLGMTWMPQVLVAVRVLVAVLVLVPARQVWHRPPTSQATQRSARRCSSGGSKRKARS